MDNDARPLLFGEVLFDRFPDGSVVLGGAPFNVTRHLQGWGLRPLFVSRVGDDVLGRRIRSIMEQWEIDTSGLQVDPSHATGTVEITIRNDEPAFDILSNQAYDFIAEAELRPPTRCAVLYHGTLALRNRASDAALRRLLSVCDCPVFMDVNLRPPWWRKERVLEELGRSRWAKLNDAELESLAPSGSDLPSRAAALQAACELEALIVTRGARGAWACSHHEGTAEVEPGTRISVTDTVGAGDAFASVMLLGLIRKWPLALTLQRAQAFASSIVGIRGAVPQDQAFYSPFIDAWGGL